LFLLYSMNIKRKIIMNAIEDGWCVTKHENTYKFTKLHHNLKEYFDPLFLCYFIKKYC
jgi:hypothetical protein